MDLICKVIFTNLRNCPSTRSDPLTLCQSLGISKIISSICCNVSKHNFDLSSNVIFLWKWLSLSWWIMKMWRTICIMFGFNCMSTLDGRPPMYRVEHTKLFQQPKIELFKNKTRPLFYKSWISNNKTIPLAFSVKYACRMKVARNKLYSVTPLLWCPLLV